MHLGSPIKTVLIIVFGIITCRSSVSHAREITHSQPIGIIGADSRVLVRGYTNMDRPVGRLFGESSSDTIERCTATAIGDRWILTAAHCLYLANGRPLRNMFFEPGIRTHNTLPFGRFPVINAYLPKRFNPKRYDADFLADDIAVLEVEPNHLNETLSARVGRAFYWGTDSLPSQKTITMGYPSHALTGLYREDNCDVFTTDDSHFYETTCDNAPGQSGSPMFFYYAPNDHHYVHALLVAKGEYGNTNYATPISNIRRHIIDSIVQDNFDPDQFWEEWKKVKVPRDNLVRVLINNNCIQQVRLAYYRYDNDGEAIGFPILNPGNTLELFTTTYAGYELYAVNLGFGQGTFLPGPHRRRSVNGSPIPMTSYRTNRFGDHFHNMCH